MNMNGQFLVLVLAVYWWYKQEVLVYLVQVPYTFI